MGAYNEALEAAARLRSEVVYPEEFMIAALPHDFGKAVSTVVEEDKMYSIVHEQTSVGIARRYFDRLTNENRTEQYMLNMVVF